MSEATSGNDNFLQKISSLCSRHYLPTLEGMPLDRVDRTRTSAEIEVFKNFSPLINEIPQRNFAWFYDFIEKISTAVSGQPSPIRRTYDVITKPNRAGDYWKFIRYPDVRKELVRLYDFSIRTWHRKSCYLAAVFIGSFLTIHPLRDSNGRTGRILFNLILNRKVREEHKFYIPMKELMQLSGYGFELAMREANVTGRWTPLVAYCCRCILAANEVARERMEMNFQSA
jgi:hypothetical protein